MTTQRTFDAPRFSGTKFKKLTLLAPKLYFVLLAFMGTFSSAAVDVTLLISRGQSVRIPMGVGLFFLFKLLSQGRKSPATFFLSF